MDKREGSHLKQKKLKRKQLKETEGRLTLLAITRDGGGGRPEMRHTCISYNTWGRKQTLWPLICTFL